MPKFSNKLSIYVDGLSYKGSGIGRYYASLIKGLLKKGVKIYTCIPAKFKSDFQLEFESYRKNLKTYYVDYSIFSIKEFITKSKLLKRLEKYVDVFHFPNVNLSYFVPHPIVITVHDLRIFTPYNDLSLFRKWIYKELFFKRAIKCADRIITVSNYTKCQLKSLFPRVGNKVLTIYEFVDPKFFKKETLDRIVEGKYILYVGVRRKHKNLANLIRAFVKLSGENSDLKLVIAGEKFLKKETVKELKEKYRLERILEIVNPSDKQIKSLYKFAKVTVAPSFYEGFGLTPLESMTVGTPVVVSDIPVFRELYKDAAYFVNPNDPNDIANGIQRVMTNSDIRRELIEKGKKRVSFFNANVSIDEYIKVYEEIL